ncbi:MAG: WGR domain-containing protein [Planctomycetaceae bacterium]|nr:WGR domain-containing protein [Planctomycetaceae bacterium]
MADTNPRLFELKEGTSDKFWEISLDGTSHTVRYGRVGTDGQSKTKDFETEQKAQASCEKLIKQKTGKGYREVTGDDGSRQKKAEASQAQAKEREPFLEAILESPDDPAAYLVYADWLEDSGDAMGELIRIQWQLEDEGLKAADRKPLVAREKALLKEHEAEWLGDLADDLIGQKGPADLLWGNKKFYQWQMGRGFLDSLHIEYLLPAFAQALKKSPLASTLRKLTIRRPSNAYDLEEMDEYAEREWDEDDAPALKLLNGTKFDNLRFFEVSEQDQCHCMTPSVQNAIKLMPRLESLQLDAHDINVAAIFRLKLPHLKSLTLMHTADRYPLEVLAANKSMGNLESLYIWPHAMDFDAEGAYIDLKGFEGLCRSKNLSSLQNLTLRLTDVGDAGLAALVKSPLYQQLKTLELIGGIITDAGVATLCEAGSGSLQQLNLTENYITKDGVKQLQGTFPFAEAKDQYSGEPTDEFEYLWNGDIE